MADPSKPFTNTLEVFSASIEDFITSLGKGISDAQAALDQNSIQTQAKLDSDPLSAQYGLQATWYQFPKVELDLKLSITVSQDQSSSSASPPAPASRALPMISRGTTRPVRIIAQPVSASYQTHFNYDAQAASTLTLTIVPVPPQRNPGQAVQPRMTDSLVRKAAFGSAAKFLFAKDSNGNNILDANGNPVPATADKEGNALRCDVNFNGAAALWYVLQYAPFAANVTPVVVAVDDVVGSQPGVDLKTAVRVISTP
jgi:hypothetical protein